jgi:Tfp pilus tip-associated adhesin PilY1
MKNLLVVLSLLLLLPVPGNGSNPVAVSLTNVSREVVSTAAVVDDGILYAASYEIPERVGHLRAIDLKDGRQTRLWDAAERIPLPGAEPPPPADPGLAALVPQFNAQSGTRQLFTNLNAMQGFRLVTFDARAAHVLQPLLGMPTVAETAALINTVRGRLGTSAANPAGSGDRLLRLGAISRSSPALVGASPVGAGGVSRDQLLYVGAEDGLLHAILAGRRKFDGSGYDHATASCGEELWGYLPGSLLPALKSQPLDAPEQLPAVHVDGAPAISDLFIDSDGDGRREWRTILVGTASMQALNRGLVFALDVTDPGAPQLLWETALAELGPGRSRGAALGWSGASDNPAPRVFVTFGTNTRIDADGGADPVNGSHGVLACALDLADGRLLWRFAAPYADAAADLAEPPSIPSLLTTTSGEVDGVVFGDLAGRLWVLDPERGTPRGGGPLWQTPGGANEPIGAGLAIRNRQVLFGTGGVDCAAEDRSYAVYAVEILDEGARLLWRQPLAPGEKLWGPPTVDRFGRVYVGVGSGHDDDGGRLLVIAADGTLSASVALAGTPLGGLTVVQGTVITISQTGQVEQFGTLQQQPPGTSADPGGRVRVLSWRVR